MSDFKLFSGTANQLLAEKIAESLSVPLGSTEIFKFSNEETRVRILEDVRNKICFLIQSISTPTDETWAETLFLIDALKRNKAKKIIGVFPWIGYQKQDKQFRSGEAISVAVVIKTLEAIGVDQITTLDLHSPIILDYFKNKPVVLSAFPLFLELIKKIPHANSELVMVAPDEGSCEWMGRLSRKLGITLVTVCKERDKKTSNIPFESLQIKGDVKGRTAIIIDDNIYTGSTLIHNARLLKEKGAKKVIAYVTHPVLSGKSPQFLQVSNLDQLIVTDTILVEEEKKFPKLKIISVANLLASAIHQSVGDSV